MRSMNSNKNKLNSKISWLYNLFPNATLISIKKWVLLVPSLTCANKNSWRLTQWLHMSIFVNARKARQRDLQIWATIRQFGGKVGQRTSSCNFEVMGCVEKAKDLTQGKRQWSIFHLGNLFDTVLDHKQIPNSFFLYIGILFWARVIWCLGFG